MNRIAYAIVLLFAACTNKSGGASQSARHSECVVVMSIDGGKPAVIQQSKMPALKKMASEGAYTWKAQTTYPSITLPSHVSMLTGVPPEVHKVLWNDWLKENGVLTIPTVFSVAKAAGMKTAAFVTKKKFKHFEVPGTLDRFTYIETDARTITHEAALYFKSEKPNLTFVHLPDADRVGHLKGWGSAEQIAALADVDAAIGEMIDALHEPSGIERCTLIVSADHGGTGLSHGSRSPDDMTIPWIAWGKGVRPGEIKDTVTTIDTAVTALHLLNVAVPTTMSGHYVAAAFTTDFK